MLRMLQPIINAAILLLAWHSFAVHSFSQRGQSRFKYQRLVAQPLILDRFDSSEVIYSRTSNCREMLNKWLPVEELKLTTTQNSRNDALRPTSERTKDIRIITQSLDESFDRTMNDTTVKPIRKQEIFPFRQQQSSIEGGDLVCRVIARSDKKLPSVERITSNVMLNEHKFSNLFHQIDDIYHAKAYQQTRKVLQKYIPRENNTNIPLRRSIPNDDDSNDEGKKMVATTIRQSLEDAGYELLSRRDLDLCEALNVGYLLRLSIVPDTSKLDPKIVNEMYPERFDPLTKTLLPQDSNNPENDFLFDQRVLVYWRGYSKEVTRGRLLLPKLDYLQASLVQRLFGNVRTQLGRLERHLLLASLSMYRHATACFIYSMRRATKQIPNEQMAKRIRTMTRSPYFYSTYKALNGQKRIPSVHEMKTSMLRGETSSVFTLSRYGGTKTKFVGSPNPRDALNPFIICEETINGKNGNAVVCNDSSLEGCPTSDGDDGCEASPSLRVQRVNERMYESLNRNEIRCPYDKQTFISPSETSSSLSSTRNVPQPQQREQSPMQLLERVSISNLVDIFTREGRRNLIQTMFTKSELVEPTFEEVVVIWRPLIEKKKKESTLRPKLVPPKILYELADMFDIQGVLPPIPVPTAEMESSKSAKAKTVTTLPSIEIRTFEGVPMANLPAVLPKTKLIFRPADAFVFDLVSTLSFVAIIGSIRFDNPKLDLIAIVSVVLWIIRTVLRYSNKLARYDLLVKKFLTSKITYRNVGAIRYIINEAGIQRSKRAALAHLWFTEQYSSVRRSGSLFGGPLRRSQLITNGQSGVQRIMNVAKHTPIDMNAALNDLEELQLVRRLDDSGQLLDVSARDDSAVSQTLQRTWGSLYTEKR